LFNWLLARKSQDGVFIVRVEDTDEARSTRASEQAILADLQWMNLQWDEGPVVDGPYRPYRQSERRALYDSSVEQLLVAGKAYRCFCSEQELKQQKEAFVLAAGAAGEEGGATWVYDGKWRDADPADIAAHLAAQVPHTVRLKVPSSQKAVSIEDAVRGAVSWDPTGPSFGDFIIQRSNGMPVYNFCVAVDDAAMKITHVLRAEEHLTNTVRQVLVLEALGYPIPTYAHCSIILGADKQKLSKRHGAMSVQQFRELGFVPSALVNYLATIGWNDGTPKEIYSPEELTNAFQLERVVKGSAVFDMEKLRWLNGQHLKLMPRKRLEALVWETFLAPRGPAQIAEDSVADGDSSCLSAPLIDLQCGKDVAGIFVEQAVRIALKDMQVVSDALQLVQQCLEYRLEDTLYVATAAPKAEGSASATIMSNASFAAVVKRIIQDYDEGTMPLPGSGPAPLAAYAKTWNAYVKGMGSAMQLSGKELFHPIRLALTGRISGPDVGEQVALWHAASGVVSGAAPLHARMDSLRRLDLDAIQAKSVDVLAKIKEHEAS